jgi:hypothetical protein
MGSCCGASTVDKELTPGSSRYQVTPGFEHLFDDKEIGGLKGQKKILLIIKIQALMKGAHIRRKI